MTAYDVMDPRKFEELWRQDQLAEDDGQPVEPYYRHPDGEVFVVYRTNPDGSVLTDSNRPLSADEFKQCQRLA